MKVQTLAQLIESIDKNENYNHQIKGKRLKKQLKTLSQTHFQNVVFKSFQVTNVAISMIIATQTQDKTQILFNLRLDRQYPFNPPQIFYVVSPGKSQYGYCKDLLNHILKNQIWGPSLTLPTFIQRIASLADSINKNLKILWTFHNQFQYGTEELKKFGVKLYQIQEYKWEYKILKLKKTKVLGFTPDCILKFQKALDSDNILKLQFWAKLKDIIQVQAKPGKKNFQLQIDYTNIENKVQKFYFGGNPSDLQLILDNMNPIQMVERKVKNFEKSGITDYNDAIQCYTTLIEHYSLTNKELTDQYMNSMKKLIQSHFSTAQKHNKMVQIET